MGSAEKAKEQLLGDRQGRTIDNKLAQVLPGYETEESLAAERMTAKSRAALE